MKVSLVGTPSRPAAVTASTSAGRRTTPVVSEPPPHFLFPRFHTPVTHLAVRGPAAPASASSSSAPTPAATSSFRNCAALVVGATGGVGRRVVARLVKEGVPVTCLVRSLDRARAKLAPEIVASPLVSLVVGDVTLPATLPPAFAGRPCLVFVCSGAGGGSGPLPDPLGPYKVDLVGTENVLALAKAQGSATHRFILVSSIGADELLNPLNLFGGILLLKGRAEEAIRTSGVPYTIVRPGGLRDEPGPSGGFDPVVVRPRGWYGLGPGARGPEGTVSRQQIADLCVEGSVSSASLNQTVEVVTAVGADVRGTEELFAEI